MNHTKQNNKNTNLLKSHFTILMLFLVLLIITQFSEKIFQHSNFHPNAGLLHAANIFWLALTLISMRMQINAMKHSNPNVFIRSVMGSMLLKMLIAAFALLAYYFINPGGFDEKSVILSLVYYLAYLTVEVSSMMKLNRSKNG